MPTPKNIHFIWAGGKRLLPPNNLAVIREWLAANPDFNVCLWVDEQTTPDVYQRYVDELGWGNGPNDNRLRLIDINTETGHNFNDQAFDQEHAIPVPSNDQRAFNQRIMAPHIRYGINRFHPNYGASSDLLRYAILAKYGGCYFDSDVRPGINTLEDSYGFDSNDPQFKVTTFSQGLADIGNDAFICTPGHNLMIDLANTARRNYSTKFYLHSGLDNDPNEYGRLEREAFITETVGRTGPKAVSQCLYQNELITTNNFVHEDPQIGQFLFVHLQGRVPAEQYRLPENIHQAVHQGGGDNNWLKVPIHPSDSLADAIQIANEVIEFESRYMHMIRFTDNIDDIKQSIKRGIQLKIQPVVTANFLATANDIYDNYNNHAEHYRNSINESLTALLEDILPENLHGQIEPEEEGNILHTINQKLNAFIEEHQDEDEFNPTEACKNEALRILSGELLKRDLIHYGMTRFPEDEVIAQENIESSNVLQNHINQLILELNNAGLNFDHENPATRTNLMTLINDNLGPINENEPAPFDRLVAGQLRASITKQQLNHMVNSRDADIDNNFIPLHALITDNINREIHNVINTYEVPFWDRNNRARDIQALNDLLNNEELVTPAQQLGQLIEIINNIETGGFNRSSLRESLYEVFDENLTFLLKNCRHKHGHLALDEEPLNDLQQHINQALNGENGILQTYDVPFWDRNNRVGDVEKLRNLLENDDNLHPYLRICRLIEISGEMEKGNLGRSSLQTKIREAVTNLAGEFTQIYNNPPEAQDDSWNLSEDEQDEKKDDDDLNWDWPEDEQNEKPKVQPVPVGPAQIFRQLGLDIDDIDLNQMDFNNENEIVFDQKPRHQIDLAQFQESSDEDELNPPNPGSP